MNITISGVRGRNIWDMSKRVAKISAMIQYSGHQIDTLKLEFNGVIVDLKDKTDKEIWSEWQAREFELTK